ncbi:MAG: transglycosylase SLT domain-containing protein [Actinomycetes bacterium]
MRRFLRPFLAAIGVGMVTTAAVTASIAPAPSATLAMPVPPTAALPDPSAAERAERASRSSARSALTEAARVERTAALTSQRRAIAAEQRALAEKRAKQKEQRRQAAKARRQAIAARGYSAGTTDPQDMARQIMRNKFDWGASEFGCFDNIIMRESLWDPTATNPSSGAYGIPQALPGRKMATIADDWRTNPATQIRWALTYIEDRYGTPCQAWGFKSANGWY